MPVPKLAVRRALALAAMSVAVAGVVACGDSDDGDGTPAAVTDRAETVATGPEESRPDDGGDKAGDSPRDAAAPQPDSTDGDGEEREVAALVEGMYADLAAGDAQGVCAVMSSAAREQIAQNVPGGSGERPEDRTCEASFEKFLDVASRTGALKTVLDAEVQDVAIDGDAATVTVSFGGPGGKVRLLKEEGEWRFGAGAVGPTA